MHGCGRQITFLNLVAAALPDDPLGFHLAGPFELREAGLLYFVLASSATLGEAHTARVAQMLSLSERTLARRLVAKNLTFLGIREEMRHVPARY